MSDSSKKDVHKKEKLLEEGLQDLTSDMPGEGAWPLNPGDPEEEEDFTDDDESSSKGEDDPADEAEDPALKGLKEGIQTINKDMPKEGGCAIDGDAPKNLYTEKLAYQRVQEEVLGKGGMGTVYHYEEINGLRRQVAIKLQSDTEEKRYLDEAMVPAQIFSPHVINIYGKGKTDQGVPFLVMEFLPKARTLGDAISEDQLTFPVLHSFLEQSLLGLRAIHAEKGRYHRDIKPANLLLYQPDGATSESLKIIDFGCLRKPGGNQTCRGDWLGTLNYLAPEMLINFPDNPKPDARADLYSLGITFYRAFTGSRPFADINVPIKAPQDVVKFFNSGKWFLPPSKIREEIPHEYDEIICKLMARHPAQRYQTAQEVLLELREIDKTPIVELSGGSSEVESAVESPLALPVEVAPPKVRLWRSALRYGLFLLLGLGGPIYFWLDSQTQPSTPPASSAEDFLESAQMCVLDSHFESYPEVVAEGAPEKREPTASPVPAAKVAKQTKVAKQAQKKPRRRAKKPERQGKVRRFLGPGGDLEWYPGRKKGQKESSDSVDRWLAEALED